MQRHLCSDRSVAFTNASLTAAITSGARRPAGNPRPPQQVQALHQQGASILQIAQQLRMSRATVRTFVTAKSFPERAAKRQQASILDPYLPYLQQRWADGCTNASQLWREMKTNGYRGVRKQVARWSQQQRIEPASTSPKKHAGDAKGMSNTAHHEVKTSSLVPTQKVLAAPRRLVWLLLRNRTQLHEEETATLAHIEQHPEVAQARRLAQQFQAMVRQRQPEALDAWLVASQASGIVELRSFATGLRQDYPSIQAALREPWSTGQVEGQITRVKFLKRQMYGRAKLDLLNHRVVSRI